MIDKSNLIHLYKMKYAYKQTGRGRLPFYGSMKIAFPAERVLTPAEMPLVIIGAYEHILKRPLDDDEKASLMVLKCEYTNELFCANTDMILK